MTNKNPNPIQLFIDENYENNSGATGFAKAAGVTYQTIHKSILGLHTSIPTKVAEALARESDFTVDEWQSKYSLWVQKELDILCNDISKGNIEAEALFVFPGDLANKYSTFKEWRESLSYSQIDFCKTFLIHQAILQKYEAGNMQGFPVSLSDRIAYLLEHVTGYSYTEVLAYIHSLKLLPTK